MLACLDSIPDDPLFHLDDHHLDRFPGVVHVLVHLAWRIRRQPVRLSRLPVRDDCLSRLFDNLEIAAGEHDNRAAVLAKTQAKLDRTRSELREFARGIHPRVLGAGGLPAALEELAERAAVPVELYMNDARYPASVEAAVYFVCSEALANVGKHADALGATVEVTKRDNTLVIVVSDDGRGGARVEEGSGLRGLADRVEALGGRLTVASRRGAGTRLVAELPVL